MNQGFDEHPSATYHRSTINRGSAMSTVFDFLPKSLMVCLLLSCGAHVQAFEISTGEQVQCPVTVNGQSGVAREIWNTYSQPEDRSHELGKAVAVMRLDEEGWPTIIFDAQAHEKSIKGSQTIWDFVYFHECAHAQNPEVTEVEANCSAYLEMGRRGLMNYHRMKQLETMHFNMMSILPIEYGGSGAQFWHQTLQCVRKAQQ
jgi:hypothetical protein